MAWTPQPQLGNQSGDLLVLHERKKDDVAFSFSDKEKALHCAKRDASWWGPARPIGQVTYSEYRVWWRPTRHGPPAASLAPGFIRSGRLILAVGPRGRRMRSTPRTDTRPPVAAPGCQGSGLWANGLVESWALASLWNGRRCPLGVSPSGTGVQDRRVDRRRDVAAPSVVVLRLGTVFITRLWSVDTEHV